MRPLIDENTMPKPKKKPAPKPRKKKSTIAKELAAIGADPPSPAAGSDTSPVHGSDTSSADRADAPAAPGPLRLEWRSPQELAENPLNWRRHPPGQIGALTGAIAEVGWAGACLFNEATGRLIDGHARRTVAIEQGAKAVPVLIGSWTEEQEKKILASLDPLSAMAVADPAALAALLAEVDTECVELQAMLDALAGTPTTPAADAGPEPPEEPKKEVTHVCPNCGCRFEGGQLIAGEEK